MLGIKKSTKLRKGKLLFSFIDLGWCTVRSGFSGWCVAPYWKIIISVLAWDTQELHIKSYHLWWHRVHRISIWNPIICGGTGYTGALYLPWIWRAGRIPSKPTNGFFSNTKPCPSTPQHNAQTAKLGSSLVLRLPWENATHLANPTSNPPIWWDKAQHVRSVHKMSLTEKFYCKKY